MASTNKTTHYDLPQWIGTDKPTFLGDLNSAMNKIDEAIYNGTNDGSEALTKANSALSKADSAASNASTALSTANSASTTANTALDTANTASNKADSAYTTANTAKNATDVQTLTLNLASGWTGNVYGYRIGKLVVICFDTLKYNGNFTGWQNVIPSIPSPVNPAESASPISGLKFHAASEGSKLDVYASNYTSQTDVAGQLVYIAKIK